MHVYKSAVKLKVRFLRHLILIMSATSRLLLFLWLVTTFLYFFEPEDKQEFVPWDKLLDAYRMETLHLDNLTLANIVHNIALAI